MIHLQGNKKLLWKECKTFSFWFLAANWKERKCHHGKGTVYFKRTYPFFFSYGKNISSFYCFFIQLPETSTILPREKPVCDCCALSNINFSWSLELINKLNVFHDRFQNQNHSQNGKSLQNERYRTVVELITTTTSTTF